MERLLHDRRAVVRHSTIEMVEHWLLAISGFLLIFSGFGEFPMYKRFMVTQIPALGWTGDFSLHLKIHYLAGIVFVSVIVFHAFYHGMMRDQGLLPRKGDVKASIQTILSLFGFGEEPKAHKYLPEQRLAYAYLGGVGLVLVITGIGKVWKNLPGVHLPPAVVTWTTLIHTFFTFFFFFGVLAHLAALVFKVNRPLVKSIFTGEVDLGYVQDRHTIWYEELRRKEVSEKEAGEEVKEEKQTKEDEGVDSGPERVSLKEEETVATILNVKGMTCQHCVMSVKKALGEIEGIQNVNVDLEKGEVRFDNTKNLDPDLIKKSIEEAGYEVI